MNKVLIDNRNDTLFLKLKRKFVYPGRWEMSRRARKRSVRLRKLTEVMDRLDRVDEALLKAERLDKDTTKLRGQLETLKWITYGSTEEETK